MYYNVNFIFDISMYLTNTLSWVHIVLIHGDNSPDIQFIQSVHIRQTH
jgi:hypothetical protein